MSISPKEFPISVEALPRWAIKGGEPFRINPLVDFYNALSLRYIVPVGGWDLDQLRGPIELRLTRSGDRFTPLGAGEQNEDEYVPPGEVAYADGDVILTRHFVWRQSQQGLITAETQAVMLVSAVLGEVGDGVAQTVLEQLGGGLKADFGVEPRLFIVDQDNYFVTW